MTDVRYKVGEVCRLADVQPYVLRYWESEFSVLAGDRNAAGPRTYSERELRVIERIKKLLYDEGYTIAGAKKRLESELRGGAFDGEVARSAEPAASEEGDTAPVVPPPLPPGVVAAAAAAKPKKRKAPKPPEPDLIFDEPVAPREAAPTPPPPRRAEVEVESVVDRSPERVVERADPRVALAVSELKEILEILSRPEP